ncbi:MAG: SAM-dependent methyltransferase, partial [Neisseriaceae bacterium]
MNQTLPLTDKLYRYLISTGLREHPALTALREETASNRMAKMQIAPEQGQLLMFLAQLAGVRRYVEV